MMFWIAGLGLAALSAVLVLWPVLRRSDAGLARNDGAMAIFKDQLSEVDRDEARGLISGEESRAARTEIKRRMLAVAREEGRETRSGGALALIVLAGLVPLAGGYVYTLTGAPGTPSIPFAERQAENEQARELVDLVNQLRNRLESDPQGGETQGWVLLAGTLMNMDRYAASAEAYARVLDRPDATSSIWSQYAEALIASERGTVTPPAQKAIDKALELDAYNPAGTYYNAQALEQAGRAEEARQSLLDRMAQEGEPQPWMEVFLQEANRMGAALGLAPASLPDFPDAPRGPSREDIEAAQEMSPEEQQAFIRSMVDGLAARLEEQPGDLQGWLQLARAQMVLGERDAARTSLKRAEPLIQSLPADNPMRQAVEGGLAELAE